MEGDTPTSLEPAIMASSVQPNLGCTKLTKKKKNTLKIEKDEFGEEYHTHHVAKRRGEDTSLLFLKLSSRFPAALISTMPFLSSRRRRRRGGIRLIRVYGLITNRRFGRGSAVRVRDDGGGPGLG